MLELFFAAVAFVAGAAVGSIQNTYVPVATINYGIMQCNKNTGLENMEVHSTYVVFKCMNGARFSADFKK